ncbi:MAG TPA: FHA domain-containing protein [Trebonia sp.]|jgi:hypothetical protein|nr:FHA domain-containing protein [Trebonia sp.]
MKITSCVPLAGQGVIARYGALVAVTDGRGPGPDLLLSAVAETAEAGGDGSDLVIRAARAALGAPPQAAWACAGVTADGGLAVLVHGYAAATVRAGDGPEVTLAVSDSKLPVSRAFTGETVTAILVIGGAAPPDERFRLGDGVVQGGGIALTATADRPQARVRTPDVQSVQPQPAQPGPPPAPPPGRGWADGPEVSQTAVDGNVTNAIDDPGQAGWHPPTLDTPAVGTPLASRPPEEAAHDAVLVDGVLCANGHFNDPSARTCRQCGIGMEQPPRHFDRRPRPSLGELVIDDGTRVTLDGDYVLGREPALDGDVLAGRARPLRINDPNGTVSRLHLKISLVGWQVEVSDLGSANGSVLHLPGGERTLAPFEPAAIEPGARIGIGHRSMQYLAYQGA